MTHPLHRLAPIDGHTHLCVLVLAGLKVVENFLGQLSEEAAGKKE